MAGYFQISPFSSFRMVNENPAIDPRYESLPLDDATDETCYTQPWRRDDVNARIQVFSSFNNDAFVICDFDTDAQVQVVPLVPISPPLLNQPYVCMNGEVDFSILPAGRYYGKYTYTDSNNVVQDIRTSPLDLQDEQPGTLLYEVTNTYNDKGTVFINGNGTNLIFCHRVKGMIIEPLAKLSAEDFEDQYYNLTQESAIPFENWTNYIGGAEGVPWWVIKKLNLLYSLKSIKINGKYFSAVDAEFKVTRPQNNINENGYWSITIQPNESYNYTQYKTGTAPLNNLQVIQLDIKYIANTNDIVIANLFKDGFQLDGVTVINKSGALFDMSIGTTAPVAGVPSTDIAFINVNAQDDYYLINHAFRAVKTVWVQGLAGTNCDLYFRYVNYNAPNFVPPNNSTKWVENTLYTFVEHPGIAGSKVLSDAFNVATGQGQPGTDWENCVLAGTNNTFDPKGKVVRCWDRAFPLVRQTSFGSDTALIVKANIPSYTLTTRVVLGTSNFGGSANAISANQANGNAPNNFPFVDSGGGNVPLVVTNPTVVFAQFYYIKP